MLRNLFLASAALVLFAPVSRAADAPLADGKWVLVAQPSPSLEQRFAIITVETKGGQRSASASDVQGDSKVDDLKIDANGVFFSTEVLLSAKAPARAKVQFSGTGGGKDKRVLGCLDISGRTYFGYIAPTDLAKLEAKDMIVPQKPSEAFAQALKVRAAPLPLQFKLQQTKDPEERKQLLKDLAAARKEVDEKLPDLYKAVVEKDPTSQAGHESALNLLTMATKLGSKPSEIEAWAEVAAKYAAPYGKKMKSAIAQRLADAIVSQKGSEALALKYAEEAAADLDGAPEAQVRVLKTLRTAQEKSGKNDAMKVTDGKLAKLEEALDAEYHKKVPPFKVEKVAGRKATGNKVAVLEMFTGAQCPPCVAADVAFDGLLKAYDPKDVVLMQYHLHIPGPDPLTNTDTIARQRYYGADIRGVPASIFNGKPEGSGGGGMAASEAKFKQYRGIIDGILEKTTDCTVTAKATLKGDELSIEATVGGLKEISDDLKLRLVVAEESIRYVGGNGIRFHHNVVRSMPGGAAGVAVKDLKGGVHTAKADLAQLRKGLSKYLDDFVAQGGQFSNPDRPLALKDLRVIAIVQDDKSHEIIQAVQVEVPHAK